LISESRMPTRLPRAVPVALGIFSLDFKVVCLFALIGLALSGAVILSFISDETAGMIFTSTE